MKILIIGDRMCTHGGLEQHVITQVNKLSERGYEVTLYTNAITEYYVSILNPNINLITPWSEDVWSDIKDYIPDIIHSHPFTGMIRACDIATRYNKPYFVTMHGCYNYGFDASPFGSKNGNAVKLVFAVDHIAEDVLKVSPSCKAVTPLYNGIDINRYCETEKSNELINELGFNENWKTLIVATRLQDGKDEPVNQLIEVLPLLANDLSGLNVAIVGEGRQRDGIINKYDNYKSDLLKVVFTNAVADIERYYNIADLVLGSARVAIEASACGKPVFQMGICNWGELVTKDNYKDTVFHKKYYARHSNEVLKGKLLDCLVNKPESIKDIIIQECDIEKIMDKLEGYYKND